MDDILKKFHHYVNLENPWSNDLKVITWYSGYTYVSDGMIAIRVPGELAETKSSYVFDALPWRQPLCGFRPQAVGTEQCEALTQACTACGETGKRHNQTCPECFGDGCVEFSNSYNNYDTECKTCEGNGIIDSGGKSKWKRSDCPKCSGSGLTWTKALDLGSAKIDPIKALQLCRDFGDVTFYPRGQCDAVAFRFDGGEGFIMPVV